MQGCQPGLGSQHRWLGLGDHGNRAGLVLVERGSNLVKAPVCVHGAEAEDLAVGAVVVDGDVFVDEG